jgi:ubiquinone/menaquinone biosynthesis C-methylase UbiE
MDHLKRVAGEFARQATNFDRWAAKADDPGRFGAALGEVRRGRLLDVACGPGVVTAALAPEASSVTGFDATEAMLEKAKARCADAGLSNVAFRSGDAENLPFKDAEFDGVVTRLAIHHFAAPQRALDEMFRVLRPGGAAVIVDDPARVEPIRTVMRALAESSRTAGIGLSVKDGRIVFFHRWRLLKAMKPPTQ